MQSRIKKNEKTNLERKLIGKMFPKTKGPNGLATVGNGRVTVSNGRVTVSNGRVTVNNG